MIVLPSTEFAPPYKNLTVIREIAVARSLLSLLESSLDRSQIVRAADVAKELAEHLRKIDEDDMYETA